jgi:hypothetical protein
MKSVTIPANVLTSKLTENGAEHDKDAAICDYFDPVEQRNFNFAAFTNGGDSN